MPNGYRPSALQTVIDDVYGDLFDLETLDEDEYPPKAEALIQEMLKPEYQERVESLRGGQNG
jgi:hypothetical protein